jgi:DNA (cytosine-5)-methyltransferase 1
MKLRGLDLFSGIGGISLALQPWVETVAYCEIEPYCQAVLLERMQSNDLDLAPIWDDVTTLNRQILDTPIDIIFGGFPCQDVSVAGKQLGIKSDTRSGLFFHIMRLVREFNPQYIFLENVAAICSNGLGTVLGEIAEAGYDAKWCCVSAAEVGAPHKRDRWWLLAYPNKAGLQKERSEQFTAGTPRNSVETLADSCCAGLERQRESCGVQTKFSMPDTLSNHRWPSRPNEPQFEWEPPRIVANSKHARRKPTEAKGSVGEAICGCEKRPDGTSEFEGVCASGVSPTSERLQNSLGDGIESRLDERLDGIPFILDRIESLGANSLSKKETEVYLNGMWALWEDFATKKVQRTTRRHGCFQEAKILRRNLFWTKEETENPNEVGSSKTYCGNEKELLRALQNVGKSLCSPYRQRLEEQFGREFTNSVLFLSYIFAPSEWGYSYSGTKTAMLYLWDAILQEKPMLHSLNSVQEIWRSLNSQRKESILLGRASDATDEYRVDRIKALGNSVVPQAAREAFRRLMYETRESCGVFASRHPRSPGGPQCL